MITAVLTGASSPLGRRVARMLDDEMTEVVLLDATEHSAMDRSESSETLLPASADVIVDLGTSGLRPTSTSDARVPASLLPRRSPLRTALMLIRSYLWSSALVYGAAPNNPKPLTEDAVLRPDVEFVFARQLASAEELVDQWRACPSRSSNDCSAPCAVARRG